MAGPKIAKTADRSKNVEVDAIPCPDCGKATRVVKRMRDRELNVAGGIYRSCSACDYAIKM